MVGWACGGVVGWVGRGHGLVVDLLDGVVMVIWLL